MSLPTYAKYTNSSNQVIAAVPVNVGWWLTPESFADAVVNLPWIKAAKEIELYGIKIPANIMDMPEDVSFEQWREEIIDQSHDTIKRWQQRNEVLRQAVIKLYEEYKANQKEEEKEDKVVDIAIPQNKEIILNSSGFGVR